MKILLTLIFSVVVLFGRGEISVFSGQDENMQKELQKLPQEEQKFIKIFRQVMKTMTLKAM